MRQFENFIMNYNDVKCLKLTGQISVVFFILGFSRSFVFAQLGSTPLLEESMPNVKATALLFRHGDRSPTRLYPNDPFKNCSWFGGLGALSEIGALMHYDNGKRLRRRYRKLIPTNELYSSQRMYVVSSAIERCLMSAQSFLAGFYPPPRRLQLLPIRWQPVAINSVPLRLDSMLAQSKPCPRYDKTLNDIFEFNDTDIDELFTGNYKLLNDLTQLIGEPVTSLWDILYLSDTLGVQKDAELEIPEWAEKMNNYILEPLGKLAFKRFTQTYVIKRVRGGALLNDMMGRLNGFVNEESSVNLNIYSAHDTTVATILSVLEITNQTAIRPEYAATIAIELHVNRAMKDDYEVKIAYFQNTNIVEPIIVNIPGCEKPCALRKFNALVAPRLTKNFDKTCAMFS